MYLVTVLIRLHTAVHPKLMELDQRILLLAQEMSCKESQMYSVFSISLQELQLSYRSRGIAPEMFLAVYSDSQLDRACR